MKFLVFHFLSCGLIWSPEQVEYQMHLEHFSSTSSWEEKDLASEGHSGTSSDQEPDPGEVIGMLSLPCQHSVNTWEWILSGISPFFVSPSLCPRSGWGQTEAKPGVPLKWGQGHPVTYAMAVPQGDAQGTGPKSCPRAATWIPGSAVLQLVTGVNDSEVRSRSTLWAGFQLI